ncbi:MAG: tyrosine-type recombinase/integrase [Selenomonadaceae bacterium]|nr:tyrosine-type recombinase/integrase [Selenomonadaceae bacterium]
MAGLKPIRIHDLRHSHASLLIYNGFPITLISKRLGHKSPDITLKVYSHMYKESGKKVAQFLQNALVDQNVVKDI